MSHKRAFEAVDNTLKDIRGNNVLMGGVTLVMAGDFRQTLPVIRRGTRADQVSACVKSSYLWQHVTTLSLSTNIRALLARNEEASIFSRNLLQIGEGRAQTDSTGRVAFHNVANVVATPEQLIECVFPNIAQCYTNSDWLCERAVLAPKNNEVAEINKKLLSRIPGPARVYKSVDKPRNTSEAVQYPVEFLNTLRISGLPPHELHLKKGSPIIALRNIQPPKVVNGTRLIVKQLMSKNIEATIQTGVGKGEDVLIPRFQLLPSDVPFEFIRV